MEIKVLINGSLLTLTANKGDKLLDVLKDNNIKVAAACGGNGKCGKCKVKLISGEIEGTEVDNNGYFLSCKAKLVNDLQIEFNEIKGNGLEKFVGGKNVVCSGDGYGIAVDIGTTTVAYYICNLKNGDILFEGSFLNPQSTFGADVISRIDACHDKQNILKQSELIRGEIQKVVSLYNEKGYKLKKLVVSGNTTMLHLFMNEDPSSIGVFPFTPKFLDSVEVRGEDVGINVNRVILLPSITSYVGSDITADMLAIDLENLNGNILLVDIGTNGEMAFKTNSGIFISSTAAGPALEGASIKCGMGGTIGAINKVKNVNPIEYTTIGNVEAKGICGSGLIDLVSKLLDNGIIEDTGFMEDDFSLTKDIYLTGEDVRKVQLAKSAISAGIKAITKDSGYSIYDIDKVYILGGLGFYLDTQNAINIGILPKELKDKILVVGNGSLYGAYVCLLDESNIQKARLICNKCKEIELANSKTFNDEFINGMLFDVEE